MAASHPVHSEDTEDPEIARFFKQTTASRYICDAYAKQQFGGEIVPVAVQGVCSYTVYAGPNHEYVAQFRLRSLQLKMEIAELAKSIYGKYVPQVAFKGQLGQDGVQGKDVLYVYVMSRMRGVSYLDFLLAHSPNIPENSCKFASWRTNLIIDIARFFARSWTCPQTVNQEYRDRLHRQYEKELGLLLTSLPARFHPSIQRSIHSLPAILSHLPMVLLHRDFSVCNIMVHEESCHLVGVLDWAEAEIAPFGLNMHSVQRLISTVHVKKGWERFDDYELLEELFWSTFRSEAGSVAEGRETEKEEEKEEEIGARDAGGAELADDVIELVKSAAVMGLLLSRGFTSRLANMPEPVPVRDDEGGAYNIRDLDGLLINPATRFTDLL